ncbi:O-antigen ligase family protein [Candidatus Tisiphia endosymbiont of Neophilaenus lineatus]|uniref:O-antigen ligase family protein n=1 Tax=Candidatus Tisiphia endosymbiont of Neophilaenus lineatus TaxID=3139336 RepID=UPI0035CA323E
MIQSLFYILVMLFPVVGLISGFSAAVTVPLLLLTILIALRDKIFIHFKYATIKQTLLSNWKLELLFCLWCLITNFYSPNYPSSLFNYLQVCLIVLIGFIVNSNIDKLSINISKIKIYFIYFIIGIIAAIALFFIEYASHGIITRAFRTIFQPKSSNQFFLFTLDRGCSLLSVLSWVAIAIIISYHRYLLALIYYLIIFYLLYISDSLASFLAFTVAGLVFLTNRLLVTKSLQSVFLKLFTLAMLTGSILMPIIAYKIQPHYASDHYAKFLPDSAKHRVFIWHFVAKQIIKKPILGHGFASSRNFKIDEKQMISYNQWTWSPLPLHPHNNIMQIILETGLIGLILFLSLIYKYIQKISNISLVQSSKSGKMNRTTENNKKIGVYSNDLENWNVRQGVSGLGVHEVREYANTPQFYETNSSKQKSIDTLNYKSVAYACFTNYYIIGMISFNIWQIWWVCSSFGAMILFQLLLSKSQEYNY